MLVHRLPGLGTRPFARYLAALGLARVIGEQADPLALFGWSGGVFSLRTTVEDLPDFLLHDYRPTPILSPWNGGSGFGVKDKAPRVYLTRLADSDGERLADYRATITAARRVLQTPGAEAWAKDRLVQELRNWLPENALPWLDAAVVLTSSGAMFPPVIGTGGNDGHLDYSSNFHQRLADVLPELGADPDESRVRIRDLLDGTSDGRLVPAAIGQFDPLAAGGPGSSVHGAAESLVNPWLFVLMVEGVTWFASAPARRLGETRGYAAMPFTVASSADGPIPGAPKEEARGEVWAPIVEQVTVANFRQIMSEARASWQGGTAHTAPAMYGAVHTFGVDRGIAAFERYGLLRRNGLAYVATPLDRVEVREAPEVSLAQRPISQVTAYRRAAGESTAIAARRFDSALTEYLRGPTPTGLLELLGRQTRVEIAATRSFANAQELGPPRHLVGGRAVAAFLAPVLVGSPEARVAAGVASAQMDVDGKPVSLRRLLLGTDTAGTASRPVVLGLGHRPVVDILADLLVWLAQHPHDDPRAERGWLPFSRHRYRTHWPDVHAWASGLLDDRVVGEYLLAFLAIDWTSEGRPEAPRQQVSTVDPDLAVLQAFASAQVIGVGVPVDAASGRQGLGRDWPVRLRAGRVDEVCRHACEVLARNLVRVGSADDATARRYVRRVPPPARGGTQNTPTNSNAARDRGGRLLAALAAPATTGALVRIASADDRVSHR